MFWLVFSRRFGGLSLERRKSVGYFGIIGRFGTIVCVENATSLVCLDYLHSLAVFVDIC